ncbi:MAG: putative bifunctional diguanylate cyclase/phosphodiesterase [Porticoccaceae bacterium]
MRKIVHRDDIDAFDRAIANALEHRDGFRVEHRVVTPGGVVCWVNTQGEVEVDATGTPVLVRGASGNINNHKLAEQEIEKLAYQDPLTGLANRRLLLDRLHHACVHTLRAGTEGAVLFIDLDRFKLLNDSLGHRAGDLLLQQVAARLKMVLREEDTVARLGGDEFVIVLPFVGTGLDETAVSARQVAEKLQERMRDKFTVNGYEYSITTSIGISIFPADGESAEAILQCADVAMYQAKKHGRNAIAFYQSDLQLVADTRLALEQALRQAVEHGELELYFQAKVDGDEQVVGAEALMRWHHPQRGMISPVEFIPVAEETGLIYALGKWAMQTACATLHRWRELFPTRTPGVAVNVSPLQFKHADFVPCVVESLARFALDPRLLTIEITESTLIENIDNAINTLSELKALGVNIAIDDFGTGYSSLYYLKHLPLDEIKIDRSYIRDILDDPGDAVIVEAIVAIAAHMDLRTVAEGVESVAQAEFLRAIGCTHHQGYLYSRPLPVAQFEQTFAGDGSMKVLVVQATA